MLWLCYVTFVETCHSQISMAILAIQMQTISNPASPPTYRYLCLINEFIVNAKLKNLFLNPFNRIFFASLQGKKCFFSFIECSWQVANFRCRKVNYENTKIVVDAFIIISHPFLEQTQ